MKKELTTKQIERMEQLKELKEILKDNVSDRLICSVKKVSSNGMSRVVSFNYMCKNGYIYNLNYKISKILGYTLTNDGVRIKGCGLDVIFNALYNINCYALDYGIIRPSKNKTESELRYNGLVNTKYLYI